MAWGLGGQTTRLQQPLLMESGEFEVYELQWFRDEKCEAIGVALPNGSD